MRYNALIIAALLLCGCGESHRHEHSAEPVEYHEHEELIELSDTQAKRFGVAVDTVREGDFNVAIRCSGIIERDAANMATVSAPKSGVVIINRGVNAGRQVTRGSNLGRIDAAGVSGGDTNAAAKAALDAAQREVDRLAPLYADKLATAAEYNAALAALAAAKAAYSPSAGAAVSAPMAGVITELLVADGSFVNAGDPIATISADERLTLRADVTAEDYPQLAYVNDARIGEFTLSEHGGKKGGVSAANGYGTIWFTFDNDGSLMPGSGVETYLLGQKLQGVISLPADAISEQQGEYYVYQPHSPGHYVKTKVTLGSFDGCRYEIKSGLRAGDAVVTSGAMTVRLAESSGAIPEGHSHSH